MAANNDAGASISVDDLLAFQSVSDAQMHPSGSQVAYVVASSVTDAHGAHGEARIWLANVDGLAAVPVTAVGTRAHSPRWSPDGETLAFLAARADDEKDQLYLLSKSWGEGVKATDCPGGVSDLAWSPDGSRIALLVADVTEADAEATKAGRDAIIYEEEHCFTRIWLYEPGAGVAAQLTTGDAQVWEMAWSPGGRELAAIVSDEPYNWSWYGARLAVVAVPAGELTTVRPARKQLTFPSWSPDGSRMAVITCTWSDQGMTGGDVLLLGRDGADERTLTEGHPRSYLCAEWVAGGERLLCTAIEDGESVIGYLMLDGRFERLWQAPVSLLRWGGRPFSRDASGGRLAVVRGAQDDPPEVWTLDLAGDQPNWSKHSNSNPAMRSRVIAPVTTLHWQSPDGTTVQGLLVRPADAGEGPLPMITLIHGGPTSLWSHDFMAARSMGWVQLLASKGYAVLLPNPRGSMGWGTAFAEANIGDMGGGDLADVLAGVDYCVQHGIANVTRLGVGGWSYGGYLTAWAITQTGRFKAAVAGASITNWISFHGVSTIPGFDQAFYPVDPYEWDGHYGQFSPMAHVRRVETPTLFLHGERDPICPVGQAHEMWRALKERGIDTQLVVYPREGHGMREREHARDVLERAVRWFETYV